MNHLCICLGIIKKPRLPPPLTGCLLTFMQLHSFLSLFSAIDAIQLPIQVRNFELFVK